MSSTANNDDEAITGINVTPLVDITLVLLIIFMVTAKIMVSQSIPSDLPKAATGEETQVVFTVAVEADGRVLADGQPVDDTGLRSAGAAALARSSELRTIIQAPSAATHGAVIHVIDELRQAGIVKLGFAVERSEP